MLLLPIRENLVRLAPGAFSDAVVRRVRSFLSLMCFYSLAGQPARQQEPSSGHDSALVLATAATPEVGDCLKETSKFQPPQGSPDFLRLSKTF